MNPPLQDSTPPPPLPGNPDWHKDETLRDALDSAADFIASDKTHDHITRNLQGGKRCIYTLEVYIDQRGEVHSRLLVSNSTAIVTRKNLRWNGSAPTPARAVAP